MKRSFLLPVFFLYAACATQQYETDRCVDPDAKLKEFWSRLDLYCGTESKAALANTKEQCQQYHLALENQALQCPEHDPTLLSGAILAHRAGNRERAQQFLDRILQRNRAHADAAVLRAQIALEEGNIQYARKFIAEQLLLTPDHAGLYEVQAAIFYLAGERREALAALDTAERLGSPVWRLAYHRGLLAEAAGEPTQALQYYRTALGQHPDWRKAASRLKALEHLDSSPFVP